ncbi:MAG: ParB/RepB/Spo0J family partition protein [Planctomycetota bacterium]
MFRLIPLSSLSAGRRNPRRVKPERDAHRRLVASIRAVGLISPLTVRPLPDDGECFRVVAGKRRLEALRSIYKGSEGDPKIKCEVLDIDDATADTLSLAENFAREGMHPLDEAEAFAKLAHVEAKGVGAVAAEFGVTARYVRQRMKLAGLADEIKAAYRVEQIDTATAEVFASVPPKRQMEVWREVDGHIHHANHAKRLIESRWIDARFARFDIGNIPDEALGSDLFSQRELIERQAFMKAQAEAVEQERQALLEDGWNEVVVAERSEVFDRLQSMAHAEGTFDPEPQAWLDELIRQREALGSEADTLDAEQDEERYDALWEQIEELDEQEAKIVDSAEAHYDEATKAHGTVFLLIDPDGQVHTEHRLPRPRKSPRNHSECMHGTDDVPLPVPTSEDLSDRQKTEVWVHEAVGVRRALLDDVKRRKVLLILALHRSIHNTGLSVRNEADSLARYVEIQRGDDHPGFESAAWDELEAHRMGTECFGDEAWVDPVDAYERLMDQPEDQLDALLSQLTVHTLAGSMHRRDPLTVRLATDLGVELRVRQVTTGGSEATSGGWNPGVSWLKGYKKIQLAHLMGVLRGPAFGSAAERMKKSELVAVLAGLFADAAAGKLEDMALADRLNQWQPSCVGLEARVDVEVSSEDSDSIAA